VYSSVSIERVNKTVPTRRRTVNRKLDSISLMAPLSLHIISTDNINKTTSKIKNTTYAHNQDKIWQLYVPKGCRMVVFFSLFDIEVSDKCQNDNFTIQYAKDEPVHRYCNSLHKVEIRKRRVQMKFHANDIVARSGIKAHACLTTDNKNGDDELPCNCMGNKNRRKRAPISTGKALIFPCMHCIYFLLSR